MYAIVKGFYTESGVDTKDDGSKIAFSYLCSGRDMLKVRHCPQQNGWTPGKPVSLLCEIRQVVYDGKTYLVVSALNEKGGFLDE